MRNSRYIFTIVLLLAFFSGYVFSATYTYGPVNSILFKLENYDVELSRTSASVQYNPLLNQCELDTAASSARLIVYSGSTVVVDRTLSVGDSASFFVNEASTNAIVGTTLTLTEIRHSSTVQCTNPLDSSSCTCTHPGVAQAVFTVNVGSLLVCNDPDGTNVNSATTVTTTSVESVQAGTDIDLFAQPTPSGTDQCSSTSVVQEAICQSASTAGAQNISCGANMACSNGLCRRISIPCQDDSQCSAGQLCNALSGFCVTPVLMCYDTDAQNIGLVGSTQQDYEDPFDGIPFRSDTLNDTCAAFDTVTEYYCTGGSRTSGNFTCPANFMCSGGRCIPGTVSRSCTDTDGGINVTVNGSVLFEIRDPQGNIISTDRANDTCLDSGSVREYYCSANQPSSTILNCAANRTCLNGACVSISCIDSDGGRDYGRRGTVEVRQGGTLVINRTDACLTNITIDEVYCSPSGGLFVERANCPGGQVCQDGTCVPGEVTISIPLVRGWNLFSIPLKDMEVNSTCSRFITPRRPWYFDAALQNWTRVTSFEPGKGYWFKAVEDCTITVRGRPFDAGGFGLLPGWNQIGSSASEENLSALLSTCAVTHGPWGYNTSEEEYIQATTTAVGTGYFVKVNASCTLR